MNISLKLLDGLSFEAENSEGQKIVLDSSPSFGGQNRGMRPTEALMSALAGCSSIDVVHMLRKGRHEVRSFRVDVSGTRREELPQIFTKIHLHFFIDGSFSQEAMNRAVSLSVTKYCSVGEMLKGKVEITFEATKSA